MKGAGALREPGRRKHRNGANEVSVVRSATRPGTEARRGLSGGIGGGYVVSERVGSEPASASTASKAPGSLPDGTDLNSTASKAPGGLGSRGTRCAPPHSLRSFVRCLRFRGSPSPPAPFIPTLSAGRAERPPAGWTGRRSTPVGRAGDPRPRHTPHASPADRSFAPGGAHSPILARLVKTPPFGRVSTSDPHYFGDIPTILGTQCAPTTSPRSACAPRGSACASRSFPCTPKFPLLTPPQLPVAFPHSRRSPRPRAGRLAPPRRYFWCAHAPHAPPQSRTSTGRSDGDRRDIREQSR